MDIREKAKILRALSETNMPFLPAKPVVLNNFPDDRKNDIEKAIKNNAEHRAERIKSDGIRQFLDVANYKVDIDISPMLPGDIVFNSHTDFSQAKLPIDFNPQHFMEAGKDAVSLTPGMVITIPAGVKHWHGAKKDSWFSHIAVEVPGEETANEWLEPVDDAAYNALA